MKRVKNLYYAAVLLVLAAGLLCAGTPDKMTVTTTSKEAMDQFVQGQTLVDNLRLTDAIEHFKKAVQADPNFALGYLYLATTAPTAKEFFADVDKAAALAKNASEGEQLWIAGFKAGAYADPAGQRASFQKLVDMFPNDPRAQTLLGTSFFGQQDYIQAVKYLKRATELDPGFASAYNQLGYAYRFLERYQDAEQTFKKYTELIPNDPNPYDSYAELLLKLGRFDESIAQYNKALSINPHFANSFAGISAALMYQGKHDEARAELQKAYADARNDGEKRAALFGTALTYIDEGKMDEALREFDKQYALGQKINDVANMSGDLTAKGNIQLETGHLDEAMDNFQKALSLIKNSDLAPEVKDNAERVHHYNAGRVALARKDAARAQAEATEFLNEAEARDNKFQIRLAHELLGTIALSNQEYPQAVRELRQANQQNPYNLYRLALAYQGTGAKEEARKYCTAATRFYGLPVMNYMFIREKAGRMLATI